MEVYCTNHIPFPKHIGGIWCVYYTFIRLHMNLLILVSYLIAQYIVTDQLKLNWSMFSGVRFVVANTKSRYVWCVINSLSLKKENELHHQNCWFIAVALIMSGVKILKQLSRSLWFITVIVCCGIKSSYESRRVMALLIKAIGWLSMTDNLVLQYFF